MKTNHANTGRLRIYFIAVLVSRVFIFESAFAQNQRYFKEVACDRETASNSIVIKSKDIRDPFYLKIRFDGDDKVLDPKLVNGAVIKNERYSAVKIERCPKTGRCKEMGKLLAWYAEKLYDQNKSDSNVGIIHAAATAISSLGGAGMVTTGPMALGTAIVTTNPESSAILLGTGVGALLVGVPLSYLGAQMAADIALEQRNRSKSAREAEILSLIIDEAKSGGNKRRCLVADNKNETTMMEIGEHLGNTLAAVGELWTKQTGERSLALEMCNSTNLNSEVCKQTSKSSGKKVEGDPHPHDSSPTSRSSSKGILSSPAK